MERVGVAFWGGMTPGRMLECVRLADSLGYDSAYVIESYASQYSVLGAWAACTKRIRIASGVTTLYSQSPLHLGMAVATVDNLSEGRFTFGIGVGHPEIVAERDSTEGSSQLGTPLARLQETIELVQEVLASAYEGRKVDFDGRIFKVDGWQPWGRAFRPRVPVYLGTFNSKGLQYAGESLDGILPVYTPASAIPQMLSEVALGATRSSRANSAIETACFISTCMSDDPDLARESVRRQLAFHVYHYAHYRRHFAKHGLEDVMADVETSLAAGVHQDVITRMVPSRIADEFGLWGSEGRIREGLDRYAAAGVTEPILFPIQPGFTTYEQATDAGRAIGEVIETFAPASS